jgi:hypothetical protein
MRALGILALVLALGTVRAEPAPEVELVVIVQADNHASVSAHELEDDFLKRELHWPDGAPIVTINFPPDSPNRHAFDRAVLGMSPDEIARYWLDSRIRSGITAPREVDDAGLIRRLVARLHGAIAYVPASSELTGVRIVARIKAGRLVPP